VRPEDRSLLQAFCGRPSPAVLFDETAPSLMDVFSAKELPLRPGALVAVESRQAKDTGAAYLALRYDDGRELALTDAGIAFAPSFKHTGELPGLPAAFCFRDYRALLDAFKHMLYGHPDTPPTRDTAVLLMTCIAVLDGAREAGFDIGREEPELEAHLAELERRSA